MELNSQQGRTQQVKYQLQKNGNVQHCVSTKGCRLTADVLWGQKMFQLDGEEWPSLKCNEAKFPCGFLVPACVWTCVFCITENGVHYTSKLHMFQMFKIKYRPNSKWKGSLCLLLWINPQRLKQHLPGKCSPSRMNRNKDSLISTYTYWVISLAHCFILNCKHWYMFNI